MKVPKYIRDALWRRCRAAEKLMINDSIVTDFINKYGIIVEDYDYCTGVEIYTNPHASMCRVVEAIENHKK